MVRFRTSYLHPEKLSSDLRRDALASLEEIGKGLVSHISENYHKRSYSIRAKGWEYKVVKIGEKRGQLRIWNPVPYAYITDAYTVRPINNKFLAIPVEGTTRTYDGAKKYPKGPRGYQMFKKGGAQELRPITYKSGAKALVPVTRKGEIKGRPMWWLTEKADVPASPPGLHDYTRKFLKNSSRKVMRSYLREMRERAK